MAAKDKFHEVVREALINDNWQITQEQYSITTADRFDIVIDFAAERLIAAEKDNEKIAVEVKSFLSPSAYYEFHAALGQFLNYREVLEEYDPSRLLYLAVPEEIYLTLFQREMVQRVLLRYHVSVIVFNPMSKEILLWKK